MTITDPKFLALSGKPDHVTVEPSSNLADSVEGTVFEITEQELATADHYEAIAEYRRVAITLKSGVEAWMYVRI